MANKEAPEDLPRDPSTALYAKLSMRFFDKAKHFDGCGSAQLAERSQWG